MKKKLSEQVKRDLAEKINHLVVCQMMMDSKEGTKALWLNASIETEKKLYEDYGILLPNHRRIMNEKAA